MKSSTVLSASQPKYVGFANHLRRQIEDGTLKPGDRLPSRAEIRQQHNITQPTIERAQAILEREGLLVSRERQGVFVAEPPKARKASATPRVASGTLGIVSGNRGAIQAGHRQSGWADYITQGVLDACGEGGQHTLFLQPQRLQKEGLEQLLEHPPGGFIFPWLHDREDNDLTHEILEAIRGSGQPIVVFGSVSDYADFDRVVCDHEAGCYELTRWLIGQGCRRILPFWTPVQPGRGWLVERLAGYRRAMNEAGLEPLPICEFSNDNFSASLDDPRAHFERNVRYRTGHLAEFLGREQRCDAILTASDGDVPPTAAACRALGYQPNVDVLIAGYDNYWRDLPDLEFEPTIPIATVDKHNWRVGRELVELLLARIAGGLQDPPELRMVQPKLLPLDTVGRDQTMLNSARP